MEDFLKQNPPSALKFDISLKKIEFLDNFTNNLFVEPRMKKLSIRLLESKNKYEKFYKLSPQNFHRIQKYMDIYSYIKDLKKYDVQHISNAWMKYFEIFVEFKESVLNLPTKRAFFNAELPGSSLSAFNHFAYANKIAFDWRASSLYQFGDSLDDAYGFYENNKSNWMMTKENNGDMTSRKNIEEMATRLIKTFGKVGIYSHDAGINIGENFDTQEEQNLKLHLGCAIIGFLTLEKGGIFIAKQYNFFRALSFGLIAIYSALFKKFYIYKPRTSRPGNSEIYLVGIEFLGIDDTTLNKLYSLLEFDIQKFNQMSNNSKKDFYDILPIHINSISLLEPIFKSAEMIFEKQIKYTDLYIKYHEKYSSNVKLTRDEFILCYKKYQDDLLKLLDIPKLPKQNYIKDFDKNQSAKNYNDKNQSAKNQSAKNQNDKNQTYKNFSKYKRNYTTSKSK